MNNYTLTNKATGIKEILNPEEMRLRIQKTKGIFTDIYTYKVIQKFTILERFFNNKIIIILFFLLCFLTLGIIFLEIFTNLIIF
tara:strand:+ start:170 stop:421 length:252 start_codon:yes stop_codon:yes gene_type:complete